MKIINQQASINIEQNYSSSMGSSLINRYISNYETSISSISIKKNKFNKLIKKLETVYTINFQPYKLTKTNEFFNIHEKDKAFFIVGHLNSIDEYIFDIYSESFELNYFLFNLIKDIVEFDTDVSIIFNKPYLTTNGIEKNISLITRKEVQDIDNSYYPYIDVDEMFTQFNKFDENILILTGNPGVGKSKMGTSYMKYLIENEHLLGDNEDYAVLYTKDEDIISSDIFWHTLSDEHFDLVIFDDLDYFLTDRSNVVSSSEDIKKNKFIGNLLSFTDGVKKNNTKIIISTNKDIKGIDTALLRKGRLFDIIELRELKNEEALNIWKKNDLPEDEFTFKGNVLQADLGSEISKRLKTKEQIPKYLKEEGVSKIKNYNTSKKIGF